MPKLKIPTVKDLAIGLVKKEVNNIINPASPPVQPQQIQTKPENILQVPSSPPRSQTPFTENLPSANQNDPNAVAQPNLTQKLNFDFPNGMVGVTDVNGFHLLTREEYKATLGQGGGFLSNQAQDVKDPQSAYLRNLEGQQREAEIQRLQQIQQAQNLLQNNQEVGNPISTNAAGDVKTTLATDSLIGGVGAAGAVGTAAATGALTGAVGGPAGVAIGAGAGLIVGALNGLRRGLIAGKSEAASNAQTQYIASTKNMKLIIQGVNKGLLDPVEAAQMWNKEKADLYQSERTLKELTSTDVQKFLSKGGDAYIKVQEAITMIPQMDRQLQAAFINPNPNAIDSTNFGENQPLQ